MAEALEYYGFELLNVPVSIQGQRGFVSAVKSSFPEGIPSYHKGALLFIHGRPERFSGRFFSIMGMELYQSSDANYVYYSGKLDFDRELIIANWIRYHITLRLKERFFALHSALLRYKDKFFAIGGLSGSGKSTVSARMIRSGAEYFTDEYLLIGAEGFSYIPRDLYLTQKYHPCVQPLYSEIMGGDICLFEKCPKKVEVFKDSSLHLIMPRRGQDLPLESIIHPFEFYTSLDFSEGIEMLPCAFASTMRFKWRTVKDIDEFLERL